MSRYMLTIPSGESAKPDLEAVREVVGARSVADVLRTILELPHPGSSEPTESDRAAFRERLAEQYRRARV